ncbi:hypothetical protein [Xanthomonas cannabis]|uniref:hypothetical protein n=1 Tax=Xanthomonas cannabis TaxID=1885674 RepID=UPI0005748779|nr:hypothetical protein [Xanthomonas cannabis]KHL59321.1 hypothetical protein OZ13_02195 [Xanthomonas cannabis pv. cannabis]
MNTQTKLKDIQSTLELRDRIYTNRLGLNCLSTGIYWNHLKQFMTQVRVNEQQEEVFVELCSFYGTKTVRRFV